MENADHTAFICFQRDADHIREIEKIQEIIPITEIWDSDYAGTTTASSEYRTYMNFRNQLKSELLKDFYPRILKSTILIAGHHGSDTFFESSTSSVNDAPYTSHLEAISPEMCVISVGDNGFGYPDSMAIRLYKKFCRGSAYGMQGLNFLDSSDVICIFIGANDSFD